MPPSAHVVITGSTVLAGAGGAAAVRGCTLQHGLPMLVEQIGRMIDFMIGPCDGRAAR